MTVPAGKKIYFLSDFHLGAPDYDSSLKREKKIVAFLETIRHDAAEIFIVGDIFDFWYEYRKVVPKGYVRLLGKLAELTDAGISIHVFVGNHDMWMSGYFEKELNIPYTTSPKHFPGMGRNFISVTGMGSGLRTMVTNSSRKYFAILPASGCLASCIPAGALAWPIISAAKAAKKQEVPMSSSWAKKMNGLRSTVRIS
jgi:hypothetical protein